MQAWLPTSLPSSLPTSLPSIRSPLTSVTRTASADWILVVQASPQALDGNLGARGFAISSAALTGDAAPVPIDGGLGRRPPRAVVIEAREHGDDVPALLRLLEESGLGGGVPTVLAAPLALIRQLGDLPVDDFVVAPFTSDEIAERIRRIELRRPTAPRIQVGGLEVDTASHQVTVDGDRIALTRLEYELLAFLVQNKGHVFTRSELLARVWDHHGPITGRTVDIHVRRLRAKLGDAAAPLETVRKVGYRFLERTDHRALPTWRAPEIAAPVPRALAG